MEINRMYQILFFFFFNFLVPDLLVEAGNIFPLILLQPDLLVEVGEEHLHNFNKICLKIVFYSKTLLRCIGVQRQKKNCQFKKKKKTQDREGFTLYTERIVFESLKLLLTVRKCILFIS